MAIIGNRRKSQKLSDSGRREMQKMCRYSAQEPGEASAEEAESSLEELLIHLHAADTKSCNPVLSG